MPDDLSPDDAKAKFGKLIDAATRTYCEFAADGGLWRPVIVDRKLVRYVWYRAPRKVGGTRHSPAAHIKGRPTRK